MFQRNWSNLQRWRYSDGILIIRKRLQWWFYWCTSDFYILQTSLFGYYIISTWADSNRENPTVSPMIPVYSIIRYTAVKSRFCPWLINTGGLIPGNRCLLLITIDPVLTSLMSFDLFRVLVRSLCLLLHLLVSIWGCTLNSNMCPEKIVSPLALWFCWIQ